MIMIIRIIIFIISIIINVNEYFNWLNANKSSLNIDKTYIILFRNMNEEYK